MLENPLTTDGVQYIIDATTDRDSEVARLWIDHYGIDDDDSESPIA